MQYINGDEILTIGTVSEIAEQLNVKKKTVYFWTTPVNIRRSKTRYGNRKIAILIE